MDRSGALVRANTGLTRVREARVSSLPSDRSGVVDVDGLLGRSYVSQVVAMGNRMAEVAVLAGFRNRLSASVVVHEAWVSSRDVRAKRAPPALNARGLWAVSRDHESQEVTT